MNTHWRLAAKGAVFAALVSLLASVAVGYFFGGVYAAALLYGAAIGVVCFTSIAVTVVLLGGRLTGVTMPLVLSVYFGRMILVVVGIGVPVVLEAWPVLAMLGGLAGVYVVENVLILFGAWRSHGSLPAPKKEVPKEETGGHELSTRDAKSYVGTKEGG